jgi:oligopeptide transport system substrate-binding protein
VIAAVDRRTPKRMERSNINDEEVSMNLKKMAFLLLCGLIAVGIGAAGREIKTTILADPNPIDPCVNWTYEVTENQWVTLVGYDYAKNVVVPRGATSWTVSADGLVWTFKIRQNWKWSDGQPVTAKDYEYTMQQIADPKNAAPQSTFLFPVKNGLEVNQGKLPPSELGVKAIDNATLQITLNAPGAWFLSSLSSFGQATPRWAREKFGKDWVRPENVVVNGPYKVTKWVTDSEVVLEKNPSYFDAGKVQISKITLYVVASESTAVAMYENGEIDTVNIPATDLDRVRKDAVLSKEFKSFPQQRMTSFRFYVDKPPFDNPTVRRAFAMAVDRTTLVTTVTRGGEIPAYTFTPPGCVGYVEPSAEIGIRFNAAGAQKLLAEAGYPGGKGLPTIVYGYNATETNARIAQALQKFWKDNLGVSVELKGVEGGGYLELMATGVANVFRQGWGMDYNDANNVWTNLFTADVTLQGTLALPTLDSLVRQAATTSDVAKRKQLYAQVEKLYVQDEAGVVPLFYQSVNVLTKPYLKRPPQPSLLEFWTWTMTK